MSFRHSFLVSKEKCPGASLFSGWWSLYFLQRHWKRTKYTDKRALCITKKTSTRVFLCFRHKMAEGHIEFTLSVCVCVFQIRVRPVTSLCMAGFKNHFAQTIIKTRRCVGHKNHVARSKVKVRFCT